MNRFRNLLLPVALMAVVGGCYGILRSFYYGYGAWADMLVSARTAAAYYPFDIFPDKVGQALDLVRALQVVTTLGLALWAWIQLGGREALGALKHGTTRGGYRSLLLRVLCGTGCFIGLNTVLTASSLHSYGTFESIWTQVFGVLCFAPALWAVSKQRQLLDLMQRPAAAELSPADTRLVAALVSPIFVAPALFCTIPNEGLQPSLVSATRDLLDTVHWYVPGPWAAAFACGSLAAVTGLGVGLLFGSLRSATSLGRRKHQLGGALLLAAVAHSAANPTVPCQMPQVDMTSPTSTFTLVALDHEVSSQQVRYHRTLTGTSGTSTYLSRQRQVEARARLELFDWNPTGALETLASNDDAWFAAFGPVVSHLKHSRPADLAAQLPSQLAVIDQGYESGRRNQLVSAHGAIVESDLKHRAEMSQVDLSSISGSLELDGHPLANARIRLEALGNDGDAPAVQMKRRLSREAWQGPSITTGYCFQQSLRGFYATTTTDAQGHFHLDGIENGTFELVVRLDGLQTVGVNRGGGTIIVGNRQNIEVGTVELNTIHVL